jgi:FkbM family methyltransferase
MATSIPQTNSVTFTFASAVRRSAWIARKAWGLLPLSSRENVWRLRHLDQRPARTPGLALWRGLPLHYCDGPAVISQLREIFVKRCYDFTCATDSPRILDCGAHVGIGVMRWRELFPGANITPFEADTAIAELLRRNLEIRHDIRTEVVSAAAWIADGSIGFNRTGADNGHVSAASSDTVSARDLAAFCTEPVDLLKLDIEGAEEAVIAHLDNTGALQRVRRLVCEWHQWTPAAPTVHEALARLVSNGFVYRISEAGRLGGQLCPTFSNLAWPGNHLIVNAWKESIEPTKASA